MQIDHDPNEKSRPSDKMSGLDIFSNLAAAAILLPLAWWINKTYGEPLAAWFNSWFH